MAKQDNQFDVYFETGDKKTFAAAVDWPGWARSGRDEQSALEALVAYGPRYARVLEPSGLTFTPPGDVAGMKVVERLEGGSGTDFGVLGVVPSADARPVGEAELERLQAILDACWQAFEAAAAAAEGKELRRGPRGGGRQRDKIVEHVLGASEGYLSALGWKFKLDEAASPAEQMRAVREAEAEAMAAKQRGELPEVGPRGGARWPLRYYVRRAAWHILDHVWEIEDRVEG